MATPVIRWPQANFAIGRSRSLVKKPSPLTISIGSARAIGMDLAQLHVDGANPFRLDEFKLALQGLALGVGGKIGDSEHGAEHGRPGCNGQGGL